MRRTGMWRLAALAVAVGVLAACGGTSASAPTPGESSDAAPADEASIGATSRIVGMWMQVHTCEQLVSGLEAAGLAELAPGVVGDFFPDTPPKELAAKEDICSGARPQRHFHFFTESGEFGSLDQRKEQVDFNGYIVDGQILHIGDETWGGTWTVEIEGDHLSLTPQITDEQVEQALADPFTFSPAGWVVAVAYPGTTWKQVPCRGWC